MINVLLLSALLTFACSDDDDNNNDCSNEVWSLGYSCITTVCEYTISYESDQLNNTTIQTNEVITTRVFIIILKQLVGRARNKLI